jgi:hypothetical protein
MADGETMNGENPLCRSAGSPRQEPVATPCRFAWCVVRIDKLWLLSGFVAMSRVVIAAALALHGAGARGGDFSALAPGTRC